jgi:phytoene synthase
MSWLQQRIFRNASKTYYNSSLFFPKPVRRDVFTLYGFVRTADDFVDCVPQDREGFYAFREEYRKAAAGSPTEHPVIGPYVELAKRHEFRPEWTEAFLYSMELDMEKSVHSSIDETLEYIYGSAEVIGLFMAKILGLPPEAFHYAQMQGRAMQFINFVRDIAEDNRLGRIYLPIGETSLADLSYEEAVRQPEVFQSFLRTQLERYDAWQREAWEGYAFIPRRYLIAVKTASDMYNWTGRVIAQDPFIVYQRKVKPSRNRVIVQALQNTVNGRGEQCSTLSTLKSR